MRTRRTRSLASLLGRAADRIAVLGSNWARRRRGRVRGRALIGVDLSTPARHLPRHSFGPLWIALIAGLLCLVALRIDVLRMRYALGDALATEQRLSETARQLTVEMRRLRDPGQLAERARELGFARAERLIDLERAGAAPAAPSPAPVASPPPATTRVAAHAAPALHPETRTGDERP